MEMATAICESQARKQGGSQYKGIHGEKEVILML